jgi:hypothetical protein
MLLGIIRREIRNNVFINRPARSESRLHFPGMRRAVFGLIVFALVRLPAAAGQESVETSEPDIPAGALAAAGAISAGGIVRGASGAATVRAVRLTEPLRIDGVLDDAVYSAVSPITDFLQTEPEEGAPATEKTELWVLFDDENVYVSFRNWESEPSRMVANEMRRDSNVLWQGNDIVGFSFDTFYDRRNAVLFTVNAIGGRQDGQVTNERQWSADWNPVWEVKTWRFEGGWTVEAALPFKSLRYGPGRNQVWGFNAMRTSRWKNEIALLMLGPTGRGQLGLQHSSMAATLVGLEAPSGSRNVEIKPYMISSVRGERNPGGTISNEAAAEGGLDVKYGITQNWTADFTYNTDFAQVEADEQQVNLTRFSLFFPEKREFFLENQGLFAFGGVNPGSQSAGETPILFYSRRIGLNQGRVVPIQAGGRLTGRFQRYSFGLLNIRTGDEAVSGSAPANFGIARVKRDILRRSSVGMIFTGRSDGRSQANGAGNTAYGIDAAFGFRENLNIAAYWARTPSNGLSRPDSSYRTQIDYNGDRYGLQLERLIVDDGFNPGVGFVRRRDMRRNFSQVRFSPRTRFDAIRKFSWSASMEYTENGAGRLETREMEAEFGIEFHNNDRFSLGYTQTYEFLPRPFEIASGITLPVQGYEYGRIRAAFNLGQQRKASAQFSVEHGEFYSGTKTAFGASRGRLIVSPQLSVEPSYSLNWVDLPEGAFTTHLAGSRITYTMTPTMFASALMQYNSAANAMTANVRLRWEYRPGSELFVVYNEERDTLASGFPGVLNRALIVKINRLFRF